MVWLLKPIVTLTKAIVLPTAIFVSFLFLAGCGKIEQNIVQSGTGMEQIKSVFQAELELLREELGFPGATAAFVLADGRSASFATGYSDVEKKIPMRPDSVLLAGSTGKTFVSATAVHLAYQGKLDLDDKVSKYLGNEDWYYRLANAEDITVRMLLNQSAGVADHMAVAEFWEKIDGYFLSGDPIPLSHVELLAYAFDGEPLIKAGSDFYYTDTNYLLAGLVIEKASGQDFYDTVNQLFLGPLGLSKEVFPQTGFDIPRIANGYARGNTPNPDGSAFKTVHKGRMTYDPSFEWTGGGFATSALGLAKWGQMLYTGKAMQFDSYIDILLGSPMGDPEKNAVAGQLGGLAFRYSLGVVITEINDEQVIGHGGTMDGYRSGMYHFPEHGLTIVVQINDDTYSPLNQVIPKLKMTLVQAVNDNPILQTK